MGAYAYCNNCEGPLKAPWDLDTRDLLNLLINRSDYVLNCRSCGSEVDYIYLDDIVEELASRIDNKEET